MVDLVYLACAKVMAHLSIMDLTKESPKLTLNVLTQKNIHNLWRWFRRELNTKKLTTGPRA
jgi:hypothetical protein